MSKKFNLDVCKILALKELCNEKNSIRIDSVYGGKRFGFIVSNKWKFDNRDFFKEDEIGRFYIESYFKMITEFNPISDVFIQKYSLVAPHINLIRKSYFQFSLKGEIGHGVELSDNVYGVIMLDYKRPFGNSDVIKDVFDAFDIDIYNDEFSDVEIEANYEYLIDESICNIFKFLIEHDFDKKLSIKNKGRLYWNMKLVDEGNISIISKIFKKIKDVWGKNN